MRALLALVCLVPFELAAQTPVDWGRYARDVKVFELPAAPPITPVAPPYAWAHQKFPSGIAPTAPPLARFPLPPLPGTGQVK